MLGFFNLKFGFMAWRKRKCAPRAIEFAVAG
ncbi:hypothetical protein Slit_0371 [Sideroxydans lithotrophicus ES-1]|uniref:Uncharacterized protein n=1 Tax=Sideroxydans lithotrophicus (strain ES-1) TaxID=580332 RepID=D5CLM5_SIDLE|nr:hypothetical protein Slit_0371 [Sideroxydans lithotrophicus ES-1]